MRSEEILIADGLTLREWHGLGGRVFDTQYTEYLMSGQRRTYAKLDNLIRRYCGTAHMKDDKIKDYWDAGIDTEDIDRLELCEYMKNDVIQTAYVFAAQHLRIISSVFPKLWGLLESHAAALLAENEIEWNGMYIDTDALDHSRLRLRNRRLDLHKKVHSMAKHILFKHSFECEGVPLSSFEYTEVALGSWSMLQKTFNPLSSRVLSAILFGGSIGTFKDKELTGKYKNGNDKYKTRDVFVYTGGAVSDDKLGGRKVSQSYEALFPPSTVRAKAGTLTMAYPIRGCDTATLQSLVTELREGLGSPVISRNTAAVIELVDAIIELRGLEKEWSSYFEVIPRLITAEGIIHQKLNNTTTGTGRLSSSAINSQNIPTGGVGNLKDCIRSRYLDGKILEIDYSSLEFRGMAFVTGDKHMYHTLNSGSDVHYETGVTAHGYTSKKDETKELRRDVKGVVFGTVFGGGVDTVSRQTGIRKPIVAAIQKAFKTTYHGMVSFQTAEFTSAKTALKQYLRGVVSSKHHLFKVEGMTTPKGNNVYELVEQTVTGRRLSYYTYDAPSWVRESISFSPTEFKNYKIQSISTGDIVPMVLGIVSTLIANMFERHEVIITNTVHDSIVFDCASHAIAEEVADIVGPIMADAPKYFKYYYGVDFDLDLPVEATFGPTWKNQDDFKKEYR